MKDCDFIGEMTEESKWIENPQCFTAHDEVMV